MKNIFFSLLAFFLLTACYDDESKLPAVEYPSIVADRSGEGSYLVATYGEEFTFEPKLGRLVGRDTLFLTEKEFEEYDYLWDITVIANNSDTMKQVISRERILNTPILSTPTNSSYTHSLTLHVTHKLSGVVKNLVWQMKVSGIYAAGLLVAETTDESNSDISLIMSRTYNSDISSYEEDRVHHQLYSRVNGMPANGVITSLSDASYSNYACIIALSEGKSLTRIEPLTMKIKDYDLQCFFYTPKVFNPQAVFSYMGRSILLNNGLCQYYETRYTDKYSLDVESEYELSKVYVNRLPYDWAILWDKKGERLIRYKNVPLEFGEGDVNPGVFNPNALPGIECIFAGIGNKPSGDRDIKLVTRYLMRKDGHYYLYEMTQNNLKKYEGARIYDLDGCTDIDKSSCYACSQSAPVFYYAVDNVLYAVPLSNDRPIAQISYNKWGSNEKITHLLIHTELSGKTTFREQPDENGVDQPYWQSSMNNVITVVTYDGKEGRVYTLPIQYPESGGIAADKYVNCYDKFGRITAIAPRN